MLGLTQEGGAGELGSEHAGLALDAELVLEPAVASHEPDNGLGEMNIEIVADDIPPDVGGGAGQQAAEKARKILFGPGYCRSRLRPCRWQHRRPQSGSACHGGGTRTHAARPCPVPSAVPARCAPAPGCRSSRRSRRCDGRHQGWPRLCRPRRYLRTWHRRRDRASGSASSGRDAA